MEPTARREAASAERGGHGGDVSWLCASVAAPDLPAEGDHQQEERGWREGREMIQVGGTAWVAARRLEVRLRT